MPSTLTTIPSRAHRQLQWATGVLVLAIITVLVALTTSTPPAGAETPAERCARETAAYNQTWKQAWVATHPGTTISDAPAPTPPYVCQDPASQTPTTTTQPSVTAPSMPTTTTPGSGGGPNMNAHGATDIPAPGTTPIVPVPGSSTPPPPPASSPPTTTAVPAPSTPTPSIAPAAVRTVRIPTSLAGQDIVLQLPADTTRSALRVAMMGQTQIIEVTLYQPGAPTRFEFTANLPFGTRWHRLGSADMALETLTGQRVALLTNTFGYTGTGDSAGFTLTNSGTTLIGTFTRPGTALPTIGDILAPAKHNACCGSGNSGGPTVRRPDTEDKDHRCGDRQMPHHASIRIVATFLTHSAVEGHHLFDKPSGNRCGCGGLSARRRRGG